MTQVRSFIARWLNEEHYDAGSYKLNDGTSYIMSDEDAALLNKFCASTKYPKELKRSILQSKKDLNNALKLAKELVKDKKK